jgi:hypothetical protein
MINTMTKQWMKNVDDQLFIHLLMKISNIEINDKWDNEGDNECKEELRR